VFADEEDLVETGLARWGFRKDGGTVAEADVAGGFPAGAGLEFGIGERRVGGGLEFGLFAFDAVFADDEGTLTGDTGAGYADIGASAVVGRQRAVVLGNIGSGRLVLRVDGERVPGITPCPSTSPPPARPS
jgi:hypothetical protein